MCLEIKRKRIEKLIEISLYNKIFKIFLNNLLKIM